MNPEEMIRYLQEQLGRAMPELLRHMLERTETRITVERDVARRDYILHIDLIFEGRRLASYQNRLAEELLIDGLRPRSARTPPMERLSDINSFFGSVPENPMIMQTPRGVEYAARPSDEFEPYQPPRYRPTSPGLRTPVDVPPLPVNPPPRNLPHAHVRPATSSAPALRDQSRRLDFGDDNE